MSCRASSIKDNRICLIFGFRKSTRLQTEKTGVGDKCLLKDRSNECSLALNTLKKEVYKSHDC